MTDSGKIYLEKGIEALKDRGIYRDLYYEFFYFLARSFTEGHALSTIGQIPSCRLINYLLNKKFESTYKHVDKTLFEVFKEFTDIFFDKYDSISNSCKPYMNYLERDELHRMKTLYTLYDVYKKFPTEIKPNTNTLCSGIISFRELYNDFLKRYDGMENIDELMDKLINLKKLIEKNTFLINGNCKDEIKYFHSPEKYLQKKQQQEEAEREAQAEKERKQRIAQQEEAKQKEESRLSREGTLRGLARVEGLSEKLSFEIGNHVNHTEAAFTGISEETTNPNTPKPLGTIISTSLGFFIPLITIYKFTPFGTWVNTNILRRNEIKNNIKTNNQDFLLNSLDNRAIELGDPMYHVTYNSVTNE